MGFKKKKNTYKNSGNFPKMILKLSAARKDGTLGNIPFSIQYKLQACDRECSTAWTSVSFPLKISTDLKFYIPRGKQRIVSSFHCVMFSARRLPSSPYLSVFYFCFPFLCFALCLQGRKVHSHRPLPSRGPAGGELPCQAPLPAEEPVQAAHGSQSPASTD